MNKPVTQPPNVKTNPGKKGKVKKSYFSVESFVTIGDKYQDEFKIRMIDEMKKKALLPKDTPVFRYSNGHKLV